MARATCSIIIPTYNHGKYIERSVQCALDQTYPNVEVIVVDDGSTDDTPERLEKFSDRIIYHRKENGGLGAARNTGIELSSGDFLQFLDADDTIDTTKVEKQMALIDSDDAAVIYSDCTCTGPGGEVIENTSYPLGQHEEALQILLQRTLFSVHAALVRKVDVLEAGMFDTARASQEDWALWLQIAVNGGRYRYAPGNLAHYDQSGSEMVTNPELMYRRTKRLFEKFMADPKFTALDKSTVDRFVACQNFQLATRAYNNRWWSAARTHFLAVAKADRSMLSAGFWSCIPKTYLHQLMDRFAGRTVSAPQ
ncbi:MAG TPA: glycosyltransferase family A protein [Pyrinomonadaceae bacterium]|nr:glycosyltransferase family A protein [Pyrinomonadaceae bacterium]